MRDHVDVLVVDDDLDIRNTIAAVLRDEGYTVATAPDGASALDVLDDTRPSLILLDVFMPNMDGPHFREVQRRRRDLLEIPTVVMTAADRTTEPLLDPAVDEALRKPIKLDTLLSIVDRHVRRPAVR